MKTAWWMEAVVYQIYPRSFMDSNGDGIGDIAGIIEKLPYLQNLGIDVLWISPMYESPNDDNGYDISDYQAILSDFGTMEDFDRLLFESHKKGMKVIMDLVVNHTSDEHIWFGESRKSRENPYRDYYIWKKGNDGGPPNNWGSCFGGSAWELDEQTNMYYLHLFSKKQPDLNWENARVRQEIYDMMTWWLDKGIDGFRMDVISMISKDPGFPDGKVNGLYGEFGPYSVHGPRVHEYLREMNEKVLAHYDIMTVGETSGVTIPEAKKYAGYDSRELNMIFQFEHMELTDGRYGKWSDARFSLVQLKQILSKWQTELEDTAWISLFWSNHDQPRAVSRFGNDGKWRETSAKMLALCLHMMRGTPYIYQGEELGMTNAYFDDLSQYRDIESINAFQELTTERGVSPDKMMDYLKAISRDNARTPMQWSDEAYGGFTTGEPWIPVNKNYVEVNVRDQAERADSVYHFYRRVINLRHQLDVIVYGKYELLEEEHPDLYVYKRSLPGKQLFVVCNFSDQMQLCPLIEKSICDENHLLISNYEDDLGTEMRPFEGKVYYIEN